MRSRALLVAIGVVAAACNGPETEPTTVAPSGISAASLGDLVMQSPCDILPEANPLPGSPAHSMGYPLWDPVAGEIVRDSVTPRLSPDSFVTRALTGGDTFENEVHDCQRLVVNLATGLRFGPLVGVLPLDPAMSDGADFSNGRWVATVVNWGGLGDGPAEYPQLGIGPGWSCLWLRGAGSGEWQARLAPNSPEPCLERQGPTAEARVLDVLRLPGPLAVPPTARWAWDDQDSVQIVGIKCGDSWCWIGPANHWQPTQGGIGSLPPGPSDEQHLARATPAGGIVPGHIGRIEPAPAFASLANNQDLTASDMIASRLVQGPLEIAHVSILGWSGTQDGPSYADHVPAQGFPITLAVRFDISTDFKDTTAIASYTTATGGAMGERPGVRIPGANHASVGAVRWRWRDSRGTEATWSACGTNGKDCCSSPPPGP